MNVDFVVVGQFDVFTRPDLSSSKGWKPLDIMYFPVMLSHFSPAPVKTDRAVWIY